MSRKRNGSNVFGIASAGYHPQSAPTLPLPWHTVFKQIRFLDTTGAISWGFKSPSPHQTLIKQLGRSGRKSRPFVFHRCNRFCNHHVLARGPSQSYLSFPEIVVTHFIPFLPSGDLEVSLVLLSVSQPVVGRLLASARAFQSHWIVHKYEGLPGRGQQRSRG
jgi:hypothetical protein